MQIYRRAGHAVRSPGKTLLQGLLHGGIGGLHLRQRAISIRGNKKAKCHGRRFRVFVRLVSCILIGPAIEEEKMGQGCHLHATAMNFGAVTAQDRMSLLEDTGFSFVNCRVTGSGALYLGRAWGTFSRVVFAFTYMDNIIIPRGWHNWGDPNREMYVLSL